MLRAITAGALWIACASASCSRSGFEISPCVGERCSGHGTCGEDVLGEPRCACDPGFFNVGPLACASGQPDGGLRVDAAGADRAGDASTADTSGADLDDHDGAAPPQDAGGGCPGAELSPFAGGDGSPELPFRICTARQLDNIGDDPAHMSATFALEADLDLSALGRQPRMIGSAAQPFAGTFDGQGHVITGLQLTTTGEDDVGLFRVLREALIEDLVLAAVRLEADGSRIGALAGTASTSELHNCHVRDSGVAGLGVIATGDQAKAVGGLVGHMVNHVPEHGTTLVDCSSDAAVTASGGEASAVGGLVGSSEYGAVRRSCASGEVRAAAAVEVGGLVGYCYGRWVPDGVDAFADQACASGAVLGQGKVGGLAGFILGWCNLRDSYAVGAVSGDATVGGLVGEKASIPLIDRCYTGGQVAGTSQIGAFAGVVTDSLDIDSSFYSSQIAIGLPGIGNGSAAGLQDLALDAMRAPAAFVAEAWDFAETWQCDPAINGGLPSFQWQD